MNARPPFPCPGRFPWLFAHRCVAVPLAALCLFAACEKADFDEDTPDDTPPTAAAPPTSSGLGTQESPLTVEQVLRGDTLPTQPLWLVGYAVGSTYRSMSNARFETVTTYATNLLLASDSLCTDAARCIPVELPTSAMQRELSLSQHPDCHRRCIMVCGTPGRYFSHNGLRNVSAGYWLPGFDLSTIVTAPSEWEEQETPY